MTNGLWAVGSYRLRDPRNRYWAGRHTGTPDQFVEEWVRRLDRDGHATASNARRPGHHFAVGMGVAHQDDLFADLGESDAAWYETCAPPGYSNPDHERRKANQATLKARATGYEEDRQAAVYQAFRAALAAARVELAEQEDDKEPPSNPPIHERKVSHDAITA